jgi:hypothetical protein
MPDTKLWAGRLRKVMSRNLDTNVGRESDGRVVGHPEVILRPPWPRKMPKVSFDSRSQCR